MVDEVASELSDRSNQASYLRSTLPTLKLKPIERNRVRDRFDRAQLKLTEIRRLSTTRQSYLYAVAEYMRLQQTVRVMSTHARLL